MQNDQELFFIEEGKKVYAFETYPLYKKLFGNKLDIRAEPIDNKNPITGNSIPYPVLEELRNQYLQQYINVHLTDDCNFSDTPSFDDYWEMNCEIHPTDEFTKEYFHETLKQHKKLGTVSFVYDPSITEYYGLPKKTLFMTWIGIYDNRLKGKGKILFCNQIKKLRKLGVRYIALYPLGKAKIEEKLRNYYLSLGFDKVSKDLMYGKLRNIYKHCGYNLFDY